MEGTLVLSLDFELFWGVRDKRTLPEFSQRLDGTRRAIPEMLALLETYGIHATWATVGFLFFDGRDELVDALPENRPAYANRSLCSYRDIPDIGDSEADDPYHFAPSLLSQIHGTAGQEIGSHTFSHFYCLEDGADPQAFRADLEAARKAAGILGVEPTSLVLPRNQASEAHLEVAREMGFRTYRGNEDLWLYRSRSEAQRTLFIRGLQYLDAHVPLSGVHDFELEQPQAGVPLDIPSSLFLRPADPRTLQGKLRLRRIRRGMESAARTGRVYHLWTHPHNIGEAPEPHLRFLEEVLSIYASCRERWGMRSRSMGELAADRLQEAGTIHAP